MSIISFKFIILAISTYIACLIVPKKHRWIILLLSSMVFYYFAGKRAMITMLALSVFSYAVGRVIEKLPVDSRKRKAVLVAGIVIVIGWLAAVKYIMATGWYNRFIVVPLGASYVSFSVLSYFTDIYWERDTSDRNIFKHILYVMFFPKISQGPITRHNKTLPILISGGDMSYQNLSFGTQRILYGLFKKIVLADRLAMITTAVFSDLESYSGWLLTVTTVLAAFELYFDFSGYMDIILGFSQTLGLEIDENFKNPFFSRSAAEFWRRWHITLGSWFKNYIYTPVVMSQSVKKLGKSVKHRVGKKAGNNIMKIIALLAVWLLTGLWHGTGINYILWGLMWGIIIIISTVLEDKYERLNDILHIDTTTVSWRLFQYTRTFFIFCTGILLTRVQSLHELKIAVLRFTNMEPWTMFDGTIFNTGITYQDINVLIIGIILIIAVECLSERYGSVRMLIQKQGIVFRWCVWIAMLIFVVIFGHYGPGYDSSVFIYQGF